ncbi:MAG: hypothetical protein ACJ8M1_02935 [Chthoniobacterales bacterium]
MANSTTAGRPAWLRHPIAQFFASLKLAVVLLAVLIMAAIAGTIYESSFDAKVARAYVYGAPWFNIWLTLLAANLAVSALSRWPWRKHHVAFLVTHLGIITLLAGSLIGRIFGTEGSITLFKGDPPTNRLLVDERELRVHDSDGIIKGYPADFLHHPPTTSRPRDLGRLADGTKLSIIDYAPALETKLNPKPVASGGAPAIHFTIATAMMNQHLDSWLLAEPPEHSKFSMGLANIEFKRGAANPADGTADVSANKQQTATDLEESIFSFSKAPEEQIGRVIKGGSTGAKVRLEQPENGNKGRLAISLGGNQFTVDVAQNLNREAKLGDSPFVARIDNYWPDFRIEEGKPGSLSDQPNNPAVLVTIRGKGIPAAAAPTNPHGADKEITTNGGPPTMPASGESAPNNLTLFMADDGTITYQLVSRKNGQSSGKLELNKPLTTGWADWQLVVDKTLPHAEHWMDFNPVKGDGAAAAAKEMPDGIRVQLDQNGRKIEQWLAAGWQVTVPTQPNEIILAYGFRQVPLPIGLELTDFEVKRNEGSDSPAGFKSTLRISTPEGESAVGSCWMNHPFSFPSDWWRAWTGLTYKMSQASWNPDNLSQSTVQILRDPGWSLKWVGSLLVVAGVFMMFYLKPYRRQTVGEPIRPSGTPEPKRERSKSLQPASR